MDFNKSFKYVDTHCHLDLYKDYKQIILESEVSNTLVVAVTNLPSIYEKECAMFQDSSNVIVALGLHPQLVESHGDEVNLLVSLLSKTQFIGEIGLDYQDNKDNDKIRQRKIFEQILDKVAHKNKVLSVHSRNSANDVNSMIGANYPGNVIMHWFSGSTKALTQAVKNGFFFSINPSMINTANGQSLIKLMPLERIVTETDGPFIKIKGNIIPPSDVEIVIKYLALLHSKSIKEIEKIIKDNFLRIISLTS